MRNGIRNPHVLLGIALLFVFVSPSLVMATGATEQRCLDLGTACTCSAPLDTNAYTEYSLAYWGPTTLGSKPCALEGVQNSVIGRSNGGPLAGYWDPTNTGEAKTNLPTVGQANVTWVLRTPERAGGQFIGTKFFNIQAGSRLALRGYRYWSSTYSFSSNNDPATDCQNSNKVMQVLGARPAGASQNVSFVYEHSGSAANQLYGWSDAWFNPPAGFDCCQNGPGSLGGVNRNAMRGKWFRIEMVMTNPTPTGPMQVKIYRKNVTDNTPEDVMIDTSVPTAQNTGDQWTGALTQGLRPKLTVETLFFDTFRRESSTSFANPCTGFVAMSHILGAHWTNPTGLERIGPALEIEGGGSQPTPPGTPSGVNVTQISVPVVAGIPVDRRAIIILLFVVAFLVLRWGFRRSIQ